MTDTPPRGWAWTELESLRAVEPNAMTDGPFGSNLKTSDYAVSGVRVVRLGNVAAGAFIDADKVFISEAKFNLLEKHEIRSGDLVIAALGDPVGRCCQVPASLGKAIVKADCVKFGAHPLIDPRFLMHFLNSPQGVAQAERAAHGIGRLRINMGDMRRLRVLVAPAPAQRHIVGALDSALARIARARTALVSIATLAERFRQSLLVGAFQGELATIRSTRSAIEETGQDLVSRLMSERGVTESFLRNPHASRPNLPPRWAWAALGDVADVDGGLTRHAEKRSSASLTVPLVSVAAVRLRTIDRDAVGSIGLLPEDGDKGILKKGDLLVVEGNGSLDHIGRVALWDADIPGARHQNHIIRVRPRDISSRYILEWLASPLGRRAIIQEATSAAGLYTLSISKVQRLPVPIAPAREQDSIVTGVSAALAQIATVDNSVQVAEGRLSALESSLLAKAFRGELVPQGPDDEPAEKLLERIRTERAAAEKPKRTRAGPPPRRKAAAS